MSATGAPTGAGRFDCPHGIWFNSRKCPMELYIDAHGNIFIVEWRLGGRILKLKKLR